MKKSPTVILAILLVLCICFAALLGVRLKDANAKLTDVTDERDQLNAATKTLTTEKEQDANAAAQRIAALEADAAELTAQLEESGAQTEAAKQEIAALNGQITALNGDIAAIQAELNAAQAELEATKTVSGAVPGLENSLSEAQAELEKSREADKQRVADIADLQSRLEACTTELTDYTTRYNETLDKLTLAEEDLAGKTALLDEANKLLDDKTGEADKLAAQVVQLTGSLTQAQEDLGGTRALLSEAEAARDAGAAQLEQLTADYETLRQTADETGKALETARGELAAAQTDAQATGERVAALQTALDEANAGAEAAAQAAEEKQAEAVKAAEEQAAEAVKAAGEQVAALQTELDEAKAAAQAAEEQAAEAVKAAGEQVAALQTELGEAKAAAQAAEEKTAEAVKIAEEKAAETLQAAKDEAAAAVQAAEDKAAALQIALDGAGAEAEKTIAELTTQIETLSGEGVGKEIENLQAQVAELTEDRDYWKGQVKSLATDLNNYMTQDRFPRFESEEMGLSLAMPAHTRLSAFNGLLDIVSADEQAQVRLSVWVDANDQPYAPGEVDIRQLWLSVEESLDGELPPAGETDDPAGCRLTIAGDGDERVVWLFEGERFVYLLEGEGETGSLETLITEIMAGIEFK